MTLLGDLQAAEPITVAPPVLDDWVRETQVNFESLLQNPPEQQVLASVFAQSTSSNLFYDQQSTDDPDVGIEMEMPDLAFSFATPASGLFYVHFHIEQFAVRNAFGHVKLVNMFDSDIIAESVFGISLITYGAPAAFNDASATGSSAHVVNDFFLFGQHDPITQIDVMPTLTTSHESPGSLSTTQTHMNWFMRGGRDPSFAIVHAL